MARALLGRRGEAIEDLQLFLQRMPHSTRAPHARQVLEQLRVR